jgi:hypothetical protein
MKPFHFDGCSMYPDKDLKSCCYAHDIKYWKGGTKEQRKEADKELRACAIKKGHPIQAKIVFVGTRVGGHPLLPFPFRWGFGHTYPKSDN